MKTLRKILMALAAVVGFTTAATAATVGDTLIYTSTNTMHASTQDGATGCGPFAIKIPAADGLPVGSVVAIKSIMFAFRNDTIPNYLVVGDTAGAQYASDRVSTGKATFGTRFLDYGRWNFSKPQNVTVGTETKIYGSDADTGSATGNTYNLALQGQIAGNHVLYLPNQFQTSRDMIYEVKVEVVAFPVPHAATIAEDKDWTALGWDPAWPTGGGVAESAVVTATETATLNVDAAETANDFKVVSAAGKLLTLKNVGNLTASSYDFSEAADGVGFDATEGWTPDAAWKNRFRDNNERYVFKGSGDNGVTLDYGTDSHTFQGHWVFDAGTHAFTLLRDSQTLKFGANATLANPTILVRNGAQVTWAARNPCGWNVTADNGGIVSVSGAGSKLKLTSSSNVSWYWAQQFCLADGGELEIATANNQFNVNGGYADEAKAQLYMPADAGTATISASGTGSLRVANDNPEGMAANVGAGSTLVVSAPLRLRGGNPTFKKWGDGTLKFTGDISGFSAGKFAVAAGTLEFASDTAATVANLSGAGAVAVSGAGAVTLSGSAANFTGVVTVKAGATVKVADASWLAGGKLKFEDATSRLILVDQTSYDGKVELVTASDSATPAVTIQNAADAEREYTNVKVTGTVPNMTIKYDLWLEGKGAWFDFTFSLGTYQQRLANNTAITNAGSAGNYELKYDGSYRASNSYNTENGLLLAMSTPYRDMNGAVAWPSQYSAAIYANMPDQENACIIAFGSTAKGATKGYLALVRGEDNQHIRLVNGVGNNPYTGSVNMSAENATGAKHLIIFTNDGTKTKVYCDGDYIAEIPSVTLGEGLQLGSIHGGVPSTGVVRVNDISDETKRRAVEMQMVRVYKGIIGPNAIAELAKEFSYVSANGTSKRTLTAASEGWNDAKWTVVKDDITTPNQQPLALSEIVLTADESSALAVDATGSYGKLTVDGEAAVTFNGADGDKLTFNGAVKIKTDVTVGGCTLDYMPVDFTGVGVTVEKGATLTYDFSTVDVDAMTTPALVKLTGVADAGLVADGKLAVTLPTVTKPYWVARTKFVNGSWYVEFGPNHAPGSEVYAKADTAEFTDDTVVLTAAGEDTKMLPGDTLVFTNAATVKFNQTVALAAIKVTGGVQVEAQNADDGYAVNGETVTIDNGTFKVVIGGSDDPKIKDAVFNISENGTLNNYGWMTVDGSVTINTGYDKTVFNGMIRGTGTIVKGDGGTLTLGAPPWSSESGVHVHPITVNGGTLVLGAGDAFPLGAVTGAGTLSIPAGKVVSPASVASRITGAGTIDTQNFSAYPDATTKPTFVNWTGKVVFPATDADVKDLGARLNAWGVAGSTVELKNVGTDGSKGQGQGTYLNGNVTVTPKVLLSGTAYINNGGSNKTGVFTELSGAGTLNYVWTGSQAITITTLTNFTGSLNYSSTASTGITVGTLELAADPAVNDRLIASTTSAKVTVTAVVAGGEQAEVVLEARSDGVYASLSDADTKAKIGENRYATVQAAIDVVEAPGSGKTLADITVSEGAEIPEGYKLQGGVLIKLSDQAAKIGDTYYPTLAAAFGAVQEDETIQVLKSSTDAAAITCGTDCTLGLGSWSAACPITVDAGVTLAIVGNDETAGTLSGKVTVNGALKTNGMLSLGNSNNELAAAGAITVETGTLSYNTGDRKMKGTLTVEKAATFVNVCAADAVDYDHTTFVANVKGTLAMGATRWSINSGTAINLYPGCAVTVTDDGNAAGAFDFYQNATENFRVVEDGENTAAVTLAAAIRFRADVTLNIDAPVTVNVSGKLIKENSVKTFTLVGVSGATVALSTPADKIGCSIAVGNGVTFAPTANLAKLTLNTGSTIRPADEAFAVTDTFTGTGYHIDGSLVLTDETETYTLLTAPSEPSLAGVTATGANGKPWDLAIDGNAIKANFVDRKELHWDADKGAWVDEDGTETTPTENMTIVFNNGDAIALDADVTVHRAYVADGASATLAGQGFLKAATLDVPAGTTLTMTSASDIGATEVTGSGTVKYDLGATVKYDENLVTADKFVGFMGTFQVASGRMARSAAFPEGITLKITDGGQLYVSGGTWACAIDASGNGWTGEDNVQAKTPLRIEGGTFGGALTATAGEGYYALMGTANATISAAPSTWDVTGDVLIKTGRLTLSGSGSNGATYKFGDTVQVESGATLWLQNHAAGSMDTTDPGNKIVYDTEFLLNGGTVGCNDGGYVYRKVDVLANSTIQPQFNKGHVIRELTGESGKTLTFSPLETAYGAASLHVAGGTFAGTLVMGSNNGGRPSTILLDGDGLADATVTLSSGIVSLAGDATVGILNENGRAINGTGTLTLNGGTLNGAVANTVVLDIAGNVTVADGFTYDGEIALADGAAATIGQKRGLVFAGAGTVNVTLTDAEFNKTGDRAIFTLADGATTAIGTVMYGDKDITDKCTKSGGTITAIAHEAKIGTTYYLTLAEAVEAADDATVTILKNVTLADKLAIDGKTVTLAADADVIVTGQLRVVGGANVTIGEHVKVVSDKHPTVFVTGAKSINPYVAGAKTSLVIDGIVMNTNAAFDETFALCGNGTDAEGTDITVNGTVYNANGIAIYNPQPGTLTVNGSVMGYTAISIKDGALTFGADATVAATGAKRAYAGNPNGDSPTGDAILVPYYPAALGYGTPVVTVSSGAFAVADVENASCIAAYDYEGVEAPEDAKTNVNVSGGEFNTPVKQDYCAEGYVPVYNEQTGFYGVALGKAKIGTTYYLTLNQAFEAVQENDKVELLAAAAIDADKAFATTFTLDLNGQQLTATTATIAAGTLTLTNCMCKAPALEGSAGGFAPNGVITVAAGATLNLSGLPFGTTYGGIEGTGSLKLESGATAKFYKWNVPMVDSANWMFFNYKPFFTDEEIPVGGIVWIGETKWTGTADHFALDNEVATATVKANHNVGGDTTEFNHIESFADLATAIAKNVEGDVKLYGAAELASLDKAVAIDLNGQALSITGDTLDYDLTVKGSEGSVAAEGVKNVNAALDLSALAYVQVPQQGGQFAIGATGKVAFPVGVTGKPTGDAAAAIKSAAEGAKVAIDGVTYNRSNGTWIEGESSVAVAKIGEDGYSTLKAAFDAVPQGGTATIELLASCEGEGIALWAADQKNVTLNLGGFTYTATTPAVGSSSTVNQAFHFEAGNTVAINNGTLAVAEAFGTNYRMVVQNYCNLTLDNVTIDGTYLNPTGRTDTYAFSNNSGTIAITGGHIIAATGNGKSNFAMDVCKYGAYAIPTVTVDGTTVDGIVEVSGGELTVEGGTFNGPTFADYAAAKALDSKSVIRVDGATAVLNFKAGTITANGIDDCGMYGVYVKSGGTATFGTTNGAQQPAITAWFAAIGSNHDTAPCAITVNNGTYTQQANGAGQSWSYFCAAVYGAATGSYTINGGTFTGALYSFASCYQDVTQTVAFNGGTYNQPLFIDEQLTAGGTRTITKLSSLTLALADEQHWEWYNAGSTNYDTLQKKSDKPSIPEEEGKIEPVEGKENTWAVSNTTATVEISNLPDNATVVLDSSVTTVTGLKANTTIKIGAVATNETTATIPVDITDAFTITPGTGTSATITLNPAAEPEIMIGTEKETVPVTPELDTKARTEKPFEVTEGAAGAVAHTIPGLTYQLTRCDDISVASPVYEPVGEKVVAKGFTTELKDTTATGTKAFYKIQVTK